MTDPMKDSPLREKIMENCETMLKILIKIEMFES